jgi:hypothetical protein
VTPSFPCTLFAGSACTVKTTVLGPSGYPIPTGTVLLTLTPTAGGSAVYSNTIPLANGYFSVTIPAAKLTAGQYTLSFQYTPDTAGAGYFSATSLSASLLVNVLPTTVTAQYFQLNIINTQALTATATVAGPPGVATPTGTLTLVVATGTGAGATVYKGPAVILVKGGATVTLPANTIGGTGTYVTYVQYQPDTASAKLYGVNSSALQYVTVSGPDHPHTRRGGVKVARTENEDPN